MSAAPGRKLETPPMVATGHAGWLKLLVSVMPAVEDPPRGSASTVHLSCSSMDSSGIPVSTRRLMSTGLLGGTRV